MLIGDVIAALKSLISQSAFVPLAGDQVASALAITATGSADLVSAATNTGGIIITAASLSLNDSGSSTTSTLELKINSVSQLRLVTISDNVTRSNVALGGLCAIQVPAGQAVSYTLTEGGIAVGNIQISWRHM